MFKQQLFKPNPVQVHSRVPFWLKVTGAVLISGITLFAPKGVFSQDSKAKTDQPSSQQQAKDPSAKIVTMEPIDKVADSAAIRQLNERYAAREIASGNPKPKQLQIVGKTPVIKVDPNKLNSLKPENTETQSLYILGTAKLNVYDVYKTMADGKFYKFGSSYTFTSNAYIYVGSAE